MFFLIFLSCLYDRFNSNLIRGKTTVAYFTIYLFQNQSLYSVNLCLPTLNVFLFCHVSGNLPCWCSIDLHPTLHMQSVISLIGQPFCLIWRKHNKIYRPRDYSNMNNNYHLSTYNGASFVNYKKGCTRLAAANDKAYQLLAHGRWFSLEIPASSTTKTGRHDIVEILLKVVLNTKNSNSHSFKI